MRLDFYVPLLFYRSETEEFVTPPRALDGRRAYEGELAQYLDFELADLGIVGGTSELAIAEEPELRISFWSPELIDDATAQLLIEEVRGQMSDGAGENGFDFEVDGEALSVLPLDGVEIRFEQREDGLPIPPANPVAIAARKGDVDGVRQGLARNPDDANRLFMNSPPLYWAIYGESEDAVATLLDAGADPNQPNSWDSRPTLSCVFQRTLDDAKTARMLDLLVKAGADLSTDYNGTTLIECAENRKKSASVEVLRRAQETPR